MTTQAHDPYRWQPRSPRQRAGKAAGTVACAVCLALAAVMLVPAVLGYERYVITSGSMTGAYDRGSIVFAKPVPVASLRVGDVITYVPPAGAGLSGLITHRIASIEPDPAGRPVFRTQGDANPGPDPWTFTLDQPTQARVEFHLPYIGFAFAALADRQLRMLVIGLPALLLGLAAARRMMREPQPEHMPRATVHHARGPQEGRIA
ncbi:MAG: signal peptidase I [Thermoleophilaceae bacterium]